jgi:hypothetical protein
MEHHPSIINGELEMNSPYLLALIVSAASLISISAAQAKEPSVFDDDQSTLTTLRDTAQKIIEHPAQTLGDLKKRYDATRGGLGKIVDEHMNDVRYNSNRVTGGSSAH